jgi:hypothetical protein
MSRGLGKLQREILDTLDEAKRHFIEEQYRGGDGGGGYGSDSRWNRPGWVKHAGATFRIGLLIYDLRASCCYLATRHSAFEYGHHLQPRFQAAFSRAARGLVKRDLLRTVRVLPIEEWDEDHPPSQVLDLDTGPHVFVSDKQVRFVYKVKRYESIHNT